jgi:hypothetical protein
MRLLCNVTVGLGLIILTWFVMIGTGFYWILEYETTSGSAETAPPHWPVDNSLVHHASLANLLVAVHPHCPCTRATIDEMEQLMAHEPERLVAHVLVYRPRTAPSGWERTDHWHRLVAIPGVEVWPDEEGAQAKQFGAISSGHCLLYDGKGRLVFSGGLTNARGHAGASNGRRIILAFLRNGAANETVTPVYGCPLFDPDPPWAGRCDQCSN